ncbi:Predicted oxidoreductase, contains short-chain dehydrogenase (SDR) and DUF2520 domains [Massilia sp. PDC64]|nr:Rossmann-like and DUF2520 domain-containing protein [Massilia sp. PDC64]SDE23817.1 Predicted oxidoreductase, contains short-chain dehydrogenase (SDR) and DUF2520 domains [Massilia sp. PDC64]
MTTLNIVGAGHVGRVLGRLLVTRGVFALQDVKTRSADSARDAVAFIGAGAPVDADGTLRPADVWMLAVADDAIAGVAAALAQSTPMAGAVVFHCSGAKASTELDALRQAGASVASVHPVRSFADPAAVAAAFDGTFCGVEGDAAALAILLPAFEAIGARPVRIDPAAKTVYHAAAVFASNYLVTVMDAALRAYEAAGIPADVARELARPLATETLSNVLRLGPEAALSGPIARGDATTVARQHAAVTAWDGPTGALYDALATATWDLARRRM